MTLILFLLLLVFSVSFLCSMLEAVFLSITPGFVAQELKERPNRGKILERLKENSERPISAILTMNTVANTFGSAVIGAMAYEKFGEMHITVFSIFLTLGMLTFGEIIPKVVGASYWRYLSGFSIYAIQLFIFFLYPVVWITETLVSIIRSDDEKPEVTREDVIATAEVGVDEGTLHSKESVIIKNLLMLNNIFVSDIMTPRSVIFALDSSMTVEEVFERYRPIRFSRIPIYEGSLDNIIGMTMRYKIHEQLSSDQHNTQLKELLTTITSLPERMTVAQSVDFFIKNKEHVALAVDEYGVVTGLVSLEDAIETLLGVEIVDELDHVTDMRQFALDQWQQRKAQFRKS
jgi:CBS domain containing-hemolysin-like protein